MKVLMNSNAISEKPANKEINVLAWWKAHQTQFPHLAHMARDYLAIPASSVASERAFSAGGNTITNKRSSLVPKTVRAAQCFRSWTQGPLRETNQMETEMLSISNNNVKTQKIRWKETVRFARYPGQVNCNQKIKKAVPGWIYYAVAAQPNIKHSPVELPFFEEKDDDSSQEDNDDNNEDEEDLLTCDLGSSKKLDFAFESEPSQIIDLSAHMKGWFSVEDRKSDEKLRDYIASSRTDRRGETHLF
ncbi:3797_t:CDS:2 [Ambispora gerdemannii]|uniref:3797_t:CDS:1 n=1 Tax=Ambispora gerdemannii TaxID=144530 RepID=A0A9N8ZEA6_9GLOM|nr:3797_t:CDS:2 [Ambispora gerdemannii]